MLSNLFLQNVKGCKIAVNIEERQYKLPTIQDRVKLDSLQTLALAQLQNFQNYFLFALTAIKAKFIKCFETVYQRSEKNMNFSIKNLVKYLVNLKIEVFQGSSFSTYDFSLLYTTLPHNLIKEKLLDLIERTFNKKVSFTLLVMIRERFSLLRTIIADIIFGLVRMFVTHYRFFWIIFILSFGTKLYRQIVGIPIGTNCVPLVADLFLFCYERNLMTSLFNDNQADIIKAFNLTSRYLDDFLNIDNPYFEG